MPQSEQYPGFGSTIRAARMGYRWHDKMRAFVRICACESKDRFAVHVVPLGEFMGRPYKNPLMQTMHFCWWENVDAKGDPFALTDLRSLVGVRRGFTAVVTDDGRVVRIVEDRRAA